MGARQEIVNHAIKQKGKTNNPTHQRRHCHDEPPLKLVHTSVRRTYFPRCARERKGGHRPNYLHAGIVARRHDDLRMLDAPRDVSTLTFEHSAWIRATCTMKWGQIYFPEYLENGDVKPLLLSLTINLSPCL